MYLFPCLTFNRHLPAYLVAAFIKRLSRLALTAPPEALLMVIPFICNLFRRHPACKVLVHRPGGPEGNWEHGQEACRLLQSICRWVGLSAGEGEVPALFCILGLHSPSVPCHQDCIPLRVSSGFLWPLPLSLSAEVQSAPGTSFSLSICYCLETRKPYMWLPAWPMASSCHSDLRSEYSVW